MNPNLVGCLCASIVTGAAAGGLGLAAGWGVLAALALYSLGASVALVAITMTVRPGEALQPVPVRARSDRPTRLPERRAGYST